MRAQFSSGLPIWHIECHKDDWIACEKSQSQTYDTHTHTQSKTLVMYNFRIMDIGFVKRHEEMGEVRQRNV